MIDNKMAYPVNSDKNTILYAAAAPFLVISQIEMILCSTMCLVLLVIGLMFLIIAKNRLGGSTGDVKNIYEFQDLATRDKKIHLKRKMKIVVMLMKAAGKMNVRTAKAMRLYREARKLKASGEYKLCWIVLEQAEIMLKKKTNLSWVSDASGRMVSA